MMRGLVASCRNCISTIFRSVYGDRSLAQVVLKTFASHGMLEYVINLVASKVNN
jgi:hypothetical protein